MNLQDQGMRFFVHANGECRWMEPRLAAMETRYGGWRDMTDASDDELAGVALHNPPMAKTVAERQKEFKEAQAAAGMVRLEAWVTKGQREKFRRLGGDEWLRKKIDGTKEKV